MEEISSSMSIIDDYKAYVLIASIVTLVLGIVAFYLLQRRKSKRNALVISGSCGAGKTVLLHQLCHNEFVSTYTSMKENISCYASKGSDTPIRVIDVPGHRRLRLTHLENSIASAKCVLFVIDAVDIAARIRDASECLYEVLVLMTETEDDVPILIICNKDDIITARKPDAVRSLLEREINVLRGTRSAQLDAIDDSGNNGPRDEYLGYEGKPFNFDHLSNEVTFVSASAKTGNVSDIQAWIDRT